MIKYALILLCFIFSALYHFKSNSVTNTRPPQVQQAVDEAFENIKSNTHWGYNGSEWYGLLGIDEEMLVKYLVSLGKKDIYIMDVGSGKGNWAHNIKNILETRYKDTEVTFHIFTITGGKECEEFISQSDHVIIHQLNQFKIENIEEELINRGLDLTNKMDVVVASWALRHMADPIGTLERLYELLNPAGGKLLSNGFFCKLDFSDQVQALPVFHPHIFALSNATVLFRDWSGGRDTDQLLLERNDEELLNLPLEYTGSVARLPQDREWQCASKYVTEFRLSDKVVKDNPHHHADQDEYYFQPDKHKDLYCFPGDGKCKELYNRLKEQGLFKSYPFSSK